MKSFDGFAHSFHIEAESHAVGRSLKLIYRWVDPTGAILFPKPVLSSARVHGLWEHTCFEAFWAKKNSPEYWEANFSPSGEWNLFHFEGYRQGMKEVVLTPEPRIRLAQNFLEVTLSGVALDELSLTAVIETHDQKISYWAWKHAAGKPDFHARQTFVSQTS